MSENALTIENLSKRYLIGHRLSSSDKKHSSPTLREVIGREISSFLRKASDVVHGKQVVQGDEVEEFWALKDVSFEVKQGEVLGIIGRNGAGKSTLLKILSRITEPTNGRVSLRGRVSSLLEVGTGFHPELTGRENIYLNGAILGMTKREIRKKFDEIVAFSEMERFLDTPVKHYSSGMYVRLAFAVAAHLEPEILIVDEVLAVGDVAFQEKCLGKIDSVVRSEGRTVLFVSHNMTAVRQLCGRAILLRNGQFAREGEPSEVIKDYMSNAGVAENVSLHHWKDRVTTGDATITKFDLCDDKDNPTDSILFGGNLCFTIEVEIKRPIGRAFIGILVQSASGDPVLELRSSHDGVLFGRDNGNFIIRAKVNQVGLYPGEYALSPFVYDDIRKVDVDWLQHCRRLWVIPSPGVHGDLKLDPKWGKYFVRSSWTLVGFDQGSSGGPQM